MKRSASNGEHAMLSQFLSLSAGERLWITTPIAVCLCALVVWAIVRSGSAADRGPVHKFAITAMRIGLTALLTAVLYFQVLFVIGYFGYYRGPVNLVWMIGVPASAAFVFCRGNLPLAAVLFPFVMVLGFATVGLLSILTGLPLD